jgi:isopentenyl-diphosphate delta-isomerase
MRKLILVDKKDNPVGTQEKIKAHRLGQLHRAFSIFIFNSSGELMLQQRALEKYHCGGLWTNTCCSHPTPKEPTEQAAHRRLKEEMGFDCSLEKAFEFIYKVKFDNKLWENEYVHVFFGKYDNIPSVNPTEGMDWKWIKLNQLRKDLFDSPDKFTYWLKKEITHPEFSKFFAQYSLSNK